MTRFMTIGPDGKVLNCREINQSDIAKCPHAIFAMEHYRDDGTCKCNDENETVMSQWGYEWKDGQWR
jgi:hypothetical protein